MSREIASLWNVFLNSKLFLFLSTPKTYKQQYLTQLYQPTHLQSCIPKRAEHSNLPLHHPSISFRFMSCIVYVRHIPTSQGDLRRKPQQISCNPKTRQISCSVPTSTPLSGFDARALFPPAVPNSPSYKPNNTARIPALWTLGRVRSHHKQNLLPKRPLPSVSQGWILVSPNKCNAGTL